jgi:hypothetical protein
MAFLKLLGTLNAAVWLGSAIAFTFVAVPAVFSDEMKQLFQPEVQSIYGRIAEVLFARFFIFQYLLGGVAVLHAIAGSMYLSRPLRCATNYALLLVIGLGLVAGLWFQPRIRTLHSQKYDAHSSVALREQATRSLGLYHGASQVLNLFALASLVVYFWRVAHPNDPTRLAGFSHKFRG